MSETAADGDDDSPLQQVVGGLVTALTLLAAFGSLALGVEGWWIFFVVGFAGLMPLAVGLTKLYEARQESGSVASSVPADADEKALATLRRRYAEGEIDEVEFEHRVERLLETESVADAREYVDRVTTEVDEEASSAGKEPLSAEGDAPSTGNTTDRESDERVAETGHER